jgi:hypothetical protein
MLTPSVIVACVALAGTAGGLYVTWRKDRDTTTALHASTTATHDVGMVNAAIAALQAALTSQQAIATDCLGRCSALEVENRDLRRTLIEAQAAIRRLEAERN